MTWLGGLWVTKFDFALKRSLELVPSSAMLRYDLYIPLAPSVHIVQSSHFICKTCIVCVQEEDPENLGASHLSP